MVDAAIIGGLLTNLVPVIRDGFSLFSSFEKDFEKLSSTLSTLHAVLEDAETKIKLKDKQTEDWLRKLKDVAYEVRDIMDECTFEDLRLQVERLNSCSSTRVQVRNCIAHPFINIKKGFKIGHKIKDVLEKLVQISSERANLNLLETRDLNLERSLMVGGRETMSLLSVRVYGRDEDRKRIVEILVNSSKDDKRLSILSIIGIEGLGKTTLAQVVFNDENVHKHFDTKIWVCISDEFDINRVMKDILGERSEASLEELQKKVRVQLNRKRFLIVLDDVWNEDENEWNKLRSALDCGSDGAFVLVTTRKKRVAEIMKTKPHFELSPLSYNDCWHLFEERAFRNETSKTPKLIEIGREIAKKCKGVPLVAKTLGGNLGFKSDEEEWCRIRDNEIWEISQNEKSVLPILRLSYYDLPYLLRRCFAFCAIFPKHTEIENEKLIQLWIAHDLIQTNENQEVEDVGNQIWDELCWRSFLQDEKDEISVYNNKVQRTCKMNGLMHDLAQSVMKNECYRMDVNSLSEDFRREIRRHVMATNVEYTTISTGSLAKIRGLQSIILHFHYYLPYSKETLSILKNLSSLRVLEVSCRILKSQDLRYVGGLKHLRYLNFSGNEIKTLPNSICNLLNLQTLNLNDCEFLEKLPRNMEDLINLRHLHLNGCYRLKYMPRGIGKLRHLKTLSLFVIGKKNKNCELDELKDLHIRGSLQIRNLERVSDACMGRGISMSKYSTINMLELQWKDNDEDDQTKTRHAKIGEALEVSSTSLKILRMEGYKGVSIPKWIGESSASLTILHLWGLENVRHAFPLLQEQELTIQSTRNLREIVSSTIPISGAFPNLRKIEIRNCRQLGALPPHLKSLKDVTVKGECSDGLLYSILDFSGLTRLCLSKVNETSILFPTAGMNGRVVTLFPLLKELVIEDMKNLRELVSPPISTTTTTGAFLDLRKIRSMESLRELRAFPNLRKIRSMENLREVVSPPIPIPITTTTIGVFPNLCNIVINRCPKLLALPPSLKSLKDVTVKGEFSDELLKSISNLSGVTHLTLMFMEERSVLFGGGNKVDDEEQGEPASTFQSLRYLEIRYSIQLSCLFDEEGCEKLARRAGCFLRNLNSLAIIGCRNLMISLEQLRNLDDSRSLQSLEITNCPKLLSSKVKETEEVIAVLRSLREKLGSKNFREDIRQGRRCRNCTPTIPMKKDPVEIINYRN